MCLLYSLAPVVVFRELFDVALSKASLKVAAICGDLDVPLGLIGPFRREMRRPLFSPSVRSEGQG